MDDSDDDAVSGRVAAWLCSMIDARDTETVYLLRAEWGLDGFEISWEVFLPTWYWLLPFLPEGHAVIPSKNVVIEFDGVDCSVYRLSLLDTVSLVYCGLLIAGVWFAEGGSIFFPCVSFAITLFGVLGACRTATKRIEPVEPTDPIHCQLWEIEYWYCDSGNDEKKVQQLSEKLGELTDWLLNE